MSDDTRDTSSSSRHRHRHHRHSHSHHKHRHSKSRQRSRSPGSTSRSSRSHRDRDHDHDHDHKHKHRHRSSHSHSHSHRSHRDQDHERPPQDEVVDEDEQGEWVIAEESGLLDYGEESQPVVHIDDSKNNSASVTKLNKLKAEIYKAELKGDVDAVRRLNNQYEELADHESASATQKQNVRIIDQRFMPTAAQKNTTEEDASVTDMLREELETRGQDTMGKMMAKQIANDGTFSVDTDYQDDIASKLAKVKQQSEQATKSRAIAKTQQLNQYIDRCWLCTEGKPTPAVTIISMATRTYLTVPPEPSLAKGTSVIVPLDHRMNTLECDDDEWEEMRNFMKSLTRMWNDRGRAVLFYENAARRSPQNHASIVAVPISYSQLDNVGGYFQQAFAEMSGEWSSHKPVISTLNKGRNGFRTSIAKEAPYFHVWLDVDGGMGHIIESKQWPRGDQFAREVIGGLLNRDSTVIRAKGRWTNDPQSPEATQFNALWRKGYDWTSMLK